MSLTNRRIAFFVLWAVGMFFLSCNKKKDTLFTSLSSQQTGIYFQNVLSDDDSVNILDYLYYYNGGGVAIGDVNGDGLQDVYFTSNQHSNKLYLNKGAFQFEDVTEKAGVAGKSNWQTGVTMADVNGDGLLDIYVCAVSNFAHFIGHNELYINKGTDKDGHITFAESAEAYGLAAVGFNTQATFFDYDKDGDLDVYIVKHSVHSTSTYVDAGERTKSSVVSGDQLMRCDKKGDTVFFTDVTTEAGIYNSAIGYGLNVVVGDFNNDNWDDVYVSNDFHENDYYYLNNKNGTFTEAGESAFGHQSRFSMGSDASDLNNDGWLDIITLDMLAADEKVLKSSVGDDPIDIYDFKKAKGYHHQYSRNCLQLNVDGGNRFSDIALYAGVSATDWSWSPLAADFNNDGIRDIFISNGIVRRPNDLDYLKFISVNAVPASAKGDGTADKELLAKMPEGKVHNYLYEGTAHLTYIDKSVAWGLGEPTLSNGAAYADLDNDGDLDIVLNNINAPAGIYRNESNRLLKNNYLTIQLTGRGNTKAFGSKVIIKSGKEKQVAYVTASRGFESASSTVLHFGLGLKKVADTLEVIWPNGDKQTFFNVAANQHLTINQHANATLSNNNIVEVSSTPFLQNITAQIALTYKHEENNFVDFNTDQLLMHELSTQGPKLAVGDVNGDGLDDFFICGAKGQGGKMFLQQKGQKFRSVNEKVFNADANTEGVDALFFDADGDADLDLYVVSGGNESSDGSDLQDCFYTNNGKGEFKKSATLPYFKGNKSVVVAADYDRDGDMDIFVGGRSVVGHYGEMPDSYLLKNKGKGEFELDKSIPVNLKKAGMVTDALWNDVNKDGWPDLVVVGEWMPVSIYLNKNGIFTSATETYQLHNTAGLWTTIHAADLNKDGYDEFVVGNLGTNSKLHATPQFPLRLYVGDLDNNGLTDQVLAIEKNGQYYPFLGKEELERAIPSVIRKRYLGYSKMAGVTVEEVFGEGLRNTKLLQAQTLSSAVIWNNKGTFNLQNLPAQVQWSPVFSFITDDLNGDKQMDILSAGNFYGVIPFEGRYDAGLGNLLLQQNGRFVPVSIPQSGLRLTGEVRDIKKLKTENSAYLFIVATNNDSVAFYKLNR